VKKYLAALLDKATKPFVGKGYIDRYLPFAVSAYEYLYSISRSDTQPIVDIPLNSKLVVFNKDSHLGRPLINGMPFEFVTTARFIKEVSADDTIFDVGANVGYYTVLGAKKAIEGTVFAFEPEANNFSLLEKNAVLNSLDNTTIVRFAVGSSDGEVGLRTKPGHAGKAHITLSESLNKVKLTTLDTFCTHNSIEKINVMKLDVEGSEIDVLRGGKEILSGSPGLKVFLEYNERSIRSFGERKEEIFEILEELGLKPTAILDEVGGKEIPFSASNLAKVLRRASYTNIFCEK